MNIGNDESAAVATCVWDAQAPPRRPYIEWLKAAIDSYIRQFGERTAYV